MNEPEPNEHQSSSLPSESSAPPANQVWDYLRFGVSLPERVLRASSAMVGGVLRESSELLVPSAFRTSKSYSIFVQQMLDFMAKDVGGVSSGESGEDEGAGVENYVARKTVGNLVEMAGLATLHLSPLTLLALISDVAYGSQTYLRELSDELKREGVLPEDTTVDHASDLLEAIRDASGTTAQAFDLPPLSVEGLSDTLAEVRQAVGRVDPVKLIPQSEIRRLWSEMEGVARRENVSLLEVGGAMSMFALERMSDVQTGSLSGVRVAGLLFQRHVLSHYSEALTRIQEQGYYETISQSARPYIDAVYRNFSLTQETTTETVLSGRWLGGVLNRVGVWLKEPPGGLPAEPESVEEPRVRVDTEVRGLRAAWMVWDDVQVDGESGGRVGPTAGLLSDSVEGGDITVSQELWEQRRAATRKLLRQGGYQPSGRNKPAQEYLRATREKTGGLPEINAAVDVLNQTSLEVGLPISLLSVERAPFPWRLGLGHPGEEYVFNSAGQSLDVKGLLVIRCGEAGQPVGSPVKDSLAGKIVSGDTRLAACIYAPAGEVDEAALSRVADLLSRRMEAATGARPTSSGMVVSDELSAGELSAEATDHS